MDVLIRFSAAAALITAVCLLLRRSNPELQVPLAAAGCALALGMALKLLSPVREFLERAAALSGLSDAYFLPVAKCVVIGIVAKGAADLCRDGGQELQRPQQHEGAARRGQRHLQLGIAPAQQQADRGDQRRGGGKPDQQLHRFTARRAPAPGGTTR